MSNKSHTIYALSTPYGKSGVAVFRVSGENALNVIEHFNINVTKLKNNKRLYTVLYSQNGSIIDRVLLFYFPNPHSFTGEDVIEIHTHGSIAVIKVLLEELSKTPARLAEPGEFSRRAFLNGKVDLTEAEAIADIIDAETEMQLKSANKNLAGSLKNLYEGWRHDLLTILSLIEAFIDFPEEDIPHDIVNDIEQGVEKLISQINLHLNDSNKGEKIRSGIKIAILGYPNVGKSTLINALSRRNVAIVSNIPGTTRDAIEVMLDIGGFPFIFTDTAGIRDTADEIEQIGVNIAKEKAMEADLAIILSEENNPFTLDINLQCHVLHVVNKSDKLSSKNSKNIYISAKNNDLDELLTKIMEFAKNFDPGENPLITRARYREHLQEALNELSMFTLDLPIELAGEHLRRAMYEIGKITGLVEVDEILDVIFSSFCIGK